MLTRPSLSGVYAITDPVLLGDKLLAKAEQAIAGGISLLQYRNKTAPIEQQQREATQLATLCKQNDVIFIINDNIELALASEADGVHLGQQDTNIVLARQKLGQQKIIGITCHADINAAKVAQQASADYVAFGRFYPSHTKPQASAADISLLARARQQLDIPIVAIGGITIDNGLPLLAQGADMLAVIHGIFGQADCKSATQQLAQLFTT